MRITNVKSYLVRDERTYLFVVVETDDGLTGVGEAGLTGRELAVQGALEHFRPLLVGQDPARIEHLWQVLTRGGFFPAQRVLMSAVSAIDIALWDLKGKALGVPVYELLGGKVRDRIACYGHLRFPDEDLGALVDACGVAVEEGWRYLRWGLPAWGDVLEPRRAARHAVDQFAAARDAVGPDIELILDVHTRLDPAEAQWLCRSVEPYAPYFIEDPLRAEHPGAYARLAATTGVPLAAGEQFCSKWEFRQLVEEELISFPRIDLCIVGGFTEARKIAGWSELHYLNIAPHNPLGPVCTAASVHFDAACANFAVQEVARRPGTLLEDVFPVQVQWEDGWLLPPDGPGLGIEFDAEAAGSRAPGLYELPRLRRADGAFTNW